MREEKNKRKERERRLLLTSRRVVDFTSRPRTSAYKFSDQKVNQIVVTSKISTVI